MLDRIWGNQTQQGQRQAEWTFPLMFGNWLVAKYMQLLYFGPKIFEDASMSEVGARIGY
jgi:hypothetical protein